MLQTRIGDLTDLSVIIVYQVLKNQLNIICLTEYLSYGLYEL